MSPVSYFVSRTSIFIFQLRCLSSLQDITVLSRCTEIMSYIDRVCLISLLTTDINFIRSLLKMDILLTITIILWISCSSLFSLLYSTLFEISNLQLLHQRILYNFLNISSHTFGLSLHQEEPG